MADSKFAALFQSGTTDQPEAPKDKPREAAASTQPRAARPIGRPPGKRSDPAFKQYSILLKRETQQDAINTLRKHEAGDLSGLVQTLLEGWLEQQGR